MPNLESHQPIITKNKNETNFNMLLKFSLLRLVGNHEQLKSALQQLSLIIEAEKKNSKLSTLQEISDRCQQQTNALKDNKELGDKEFDELNLQILYPIHHYANLSEQIAIPRSQFLAIIHQNLNDIFLEIQNGFRFQDEKSDQEAIKKATKTVQKKQKQIEREYRLLNSSSQSKITIFELVIVAGVDIALNWNIPSSAINHIILFGSFAVAGGIEIGNHLFNRRSLLTNLLYTLPSALISRLRRNSAEQNEQAPLLNNAAINSDVPNNNSYGSMNAQLVQAAEQTVQTTVVTEILSEVPSSATLNQETEDLENATFNDEIQESIEPETDSNSLAPGN